MKRWWSRVDTMLTAIFRNLVERFRMENVSAWLDDWVIIPFYLRTPCS